MVDAMTKDLTAHKGTAMRKPGRKQESKDPPTHVMSVAGKVHKYRTSAYAGRAIMRKLGWRAEVMEQFRGPMRFDVFGADVIAVKRGCPVTLIQFYRDVDEKRHTREMLPESDTAAVLGSGAAYLHIALHKVGDIWTTAWQWEARLRSDGVQWDKIELREKVTVGGKE